MKMNYNIFKGILSLIVLSFLFVTLMPLVNSGSEVINTFLVYEDSASSTSKTVTQGDVFNVVMVAYGHGEALQNERLELVGSTLIFQESVSGDKIDTYTWLYTKTYTMNTGILTPGTYTLRFTAKTATTSSVEYSDLQLTILPKIVPPVCGNNIKEGTEQCDYGTNNGKVCSPLYGSSCTYCSSTCKLVTLTGGSCGDGTCSAINGETCSTCPTDCGVCPDNIKPVVDITNPLATTYTSHRTSLTFSVYDDNLQSCTYKLNNANPISIFANNGANGIMGITSVVGSNTWTVTCRDVAGNVGSDSVTFTVVLPPVCGDGVKEGTEQCDYGTNNGKVCSPLYGSSCTYCSSTCKLVTLTGGSCGDGTCSAINGETCSTCPTDCGVCPDNIKPVVDITNPLATTYTSHRTSLTFSVYDDNLQSCTYKLNGNAVVNIPSIANGVKTITGITSVIGTNTWTVTCRDVAGNVGSDSVTFTVTLPVICGDGVKEGTEQCDYGTNNGKVCSPLYGSSCTYCSSTCKLVTLTGGSCGDGVKQANEACDDGNLVNGDGCSSICQIEEAKECILQLTKSVDKTNVKVGEVVLFTLKYKNVGDGACTGGGVKVQDILNSNLEYLGSYTKTLTGDSDLQGLSFGYSSTPGFDGVSNTLTWNAHVVSPGEEGTIKFSAKVLEPSQCGDFQINNYFNLWSNEKGWQNSNTIKLYVDNDCYLPVCGNNILDSGEQCDYGTNNGKVCSPLYGSSCTYCSSTCKLVTLTGGSCGDGTCSAINGETCSTCPTDCGVCPAACDLTQAYWSVSNALNGQVVSLNVKGTNCDGKTILFKVWNDKTGSSDLYVTDTATDVMENGFASSAWVAIAPYDQDSTPEYYFVASIFEGTESVKSGNLLVNLPATCGDGTCNSNENCSTCPQDCGVCPDNIKPVVNIINPTNTTYTSHRTSLTFSVYDDNLQSCTYKLNGAPQVNVVSLNNGINIITGITSVNGTNTWEVVCKDASGNIGTDSVTFTVKKSCTSCCGDGICDASVGENCSTCPTDCGVCPKNCTTCKDSKPLDDSNYVPSGKTIIVYEDSDDLPDKQEKDLDLNRTPLIALILIMGILILLILVIVIRLARR